MGGDCWDAELAEYGGGEARRALVASSEQFRGDCDCGCGCGPGPGLGRMRLRE
jgi:hypothetical protein